MYINIKSNKLSMHKNQCNLKSRNEKKIFETNCRFDVFKKCHFMPFLVAFFKVWSGVFQSLQTAVAFFKVCKNCSGIFTNRHNWSGIYLIFFEMEAGCQRAVRDTLACLDSLFFYVYHRPAQ